MNLIGKVPSTIKELITLPGVGRKCANVIMLEAFGCAEGIAVDTHAKRISNRLGLSDKNEAWKPGPSRPLGLRSKNFPKRISERY